MGSSDVRPGQWLMNPFNYPDLFSKKTELHSVVFVTAAQSHNKDLEASRGANACWTNKSSLNREYLLSTGYSWVYFEIKIGNVIWIIAEKDPGNHISLFIFV